MASIDHAEPSRFLYTAYRANDWVAIFLKTYHTGEVLQRVVPLSAATGAPFQRWLMRQNARGWNVYVSVNAVRPGQSRTRRAIAGIRHVFLEEDTDGLGLLAALTIRPDLPPPSYVLHSSPGRLHVFWRTRGFVRERVEALQKMLAAQFGTDSAATSCAQLTRLPGFLNQKRASPWPVRVEYLRPDSTLDPDDFPETRAPASSFAMSGSATRLAVHRHPDRVHRAMRFLQSVERAIAGQHGDVRTFRVCCRVVRGFALEDDEALHVLRDWNSRCEPVWSERELRQKVRNARRYGREPIGGLLDQ